MDEPEQSDFAKETVTLAICSTKMRYIIRKMKMLS